MTRPPQEPVQATLATTWGPVVITADAAGLLACHLPDAGTPRGPLRTGRATLPPHAPPALRQAVAAAAALLAGRAPAQLPPLSPAAWAGATAFQRAIWRAMQRIPRGRTMTYAELARRAGRPRASRAAGGACGANPLPLFVPCHRIVATGGGLGGFSGGLAWKVHLLRVEGARP